MCKSEARMQTQDNTVISASPVVPSKYCCRPRLISLYNKERLSLPICNVVVPSTSTRFHREIRFSSIRVYVTGLSLSDALPSK